MDSNTGKDINNTPMEIVIKASSSMDCHKDTVNMFGKITPAIKEISSKGIEMDTVFGIASQALNKTIRGIICLTKNMDMEYMTGATAIYIKVLLLRICDQEKDSCTSNKS